MKHIHFDKLNSTQTYLIENIDLLKNESLDLIISTGNQFSGVGRKGNLWDQVENAIASSFTLKPNEIVTLTPLEAGVLMSEYLEKYHNANVLLKWPNDLMTSEGKKCGGIISTYIDKETIIVGAGINFGTTQSQTKPEYKNPIGHATSLELNQDEIKELPLNIYEYILANRIPAKELYIRWNDKCYHKDKMVKIVSGNDIIEGRFVGLGNFGEALIQTETEVKKAAAGSLYFSTQ